MKQKILDAGLAVLLVGAVISMFVMANAVKEVHAENEKLQKENNELLMDKINLEIDLENITDAYWQLNNRLERMEGEGE
ncbi:hypothetical protein [Oceanobacillus oncorhynchi]|uniref:hypothetical protein n=1 Tax=Oceanobacillus oncorhynchi TaxID=545501 RepID=UPI0025A4AE58|nr:hypothetical protein [Oceanobacillus oncorhynchi]MDM8098682.1 hypothetical protein [Oceanobacillus oncorhynchi]